jgi:hypothetical protein
VAALLAVAPSPSELLFDLVNHVCIWMVCILLVTPLHMLHVHST